MEYLIIGLPLLMVFMWWSNRNARKMQAAKQQETENAMVEGAWIMTKSGFYGQFVERDGDVVTLTGPTGEESYWDMAAIAVVKDPPFQPLAESEEIAAKTQGEQDSPEEEAGSDDIQEYLDKWSKDEDNK